MRRMYSKKQVEEIAQSAVNSGTKLYKHTISFNQGGSALQLVSNSNTPITQETLDEILSNYKFIIAYYFSEDYASGVFV